MTNEQSRRTSDDKDAISCSTDGMRSGEKSPTNIEAHNNSSSPLSKIKEIFRLERTPSPRTSLLMFC